MGEYTLGEKWLANRRALQTMAAASQKYKCKLFRSNKCSIPTRWVSQRNQVILSLTLCTHNSNQCMRTRCRACRLCRCRGRLLFKQMLKCTHKLLPKLVSFKVS